MTIRWSIVLCCTLMLAAAVQADIVALNANGEEALIHNPNQPGTPATAIGRIMGGIYFAGVAAWDYDGNLAGEEIIFSRQLGQQAGSNGLSVYRNDSSTRINYKLPTNYHLAGLKTGMVLDGGTRRGLVALRPDVQASTNKPLFEIWDPANINPSGSRDEYQRGAVAGTKWSPDSLGVGELSSTGAGDEVVTVQGTSGQPSLRTVEFYGRTGGSGNTTYTRLGVIGEFADVAGVTVGAGVMPGGGNAIVTLRSDGRISFWQVAADHSVSRLGYTAANSYSENFIEIADVLDSNPGQEIIVGYNDVSAGERGYQLYSLPDPSGLTGGAVGISLLGSYDLGAEIRAVDAINLIPEPTTMILLAVGSLHMFLRRRRR